MLLGGRLVGKDHRSSPTATHKKDNQKTCSNFVTQRFTIRACYGTHKPQHKYFPNSQLITSMTLISPSSYLKTIIRNQTSHSIQCTLYESFYYIPLGFLSY